MPEAEAPLVSPGRDGVVEPVTQRLQLRIQAIEVLSYALAHNRIPVIGQITLEGVAESFRGAEVRVQISDAQGRLSQPFSSTVDLEAGQQTVLRDLPLRLDPSEMLQVEEQRPGEISVEIWSGPGVGEAGLLTAARVPVQILAASQWLRTGAAVTDEILASFVQPNHPAVGRLLLEAVTILGERTGKPSLDSYQADPERVDDQVQAVVRAAEARQIRYAEPPASWSDRGQKVRNPGEVFEEQIGTCLDLMLALAAALEQAGIRPLLFLVEGHAFLGYWRVEASLQVILETDPAAVINLVDLGAIGLVETTLITTGRDPVTFAQLAQAPYATWLTGDVSRVQGIIDVYEARRNGIIPLPARVRTHDAVQIFEYVPVARADGTPRPGQLSPGVRAGDRDPVPARVQHWKNALLDLTLRNRLINFSPRTGLTLAVPGGLLGRLEDAVNEPRMITVLPLDAIDAIHAGRGIASGAELPPDQLDGLLARGQVFCDLPGSAYANRMRQLAYKARTIVEESGANNLYLALGTLVWSLDDRQLRSPLVLVPVHLKPARRGGVYRLSLDESGASTPNFCLLEKLRQAHGLEIPELAEPELDGSGIDLDAALLAVRRAVNAASLPFRVEETAHVAILQFAKFRLWKDLDEHWQRFGQNALVRHLIETPTAAFSDPVSQPSQDPAPAEGPDLDELAAGCPVAADSSQLAAVADAVAGRTFVLEGPPGTGKSQTITNLLTQALVAGQRILFVAEKRAALDVVRRRLEDVGMGPFALDLHDKASRPGLVRAQLKEALDATIEVDAQGLAVQQERLRSARQTLARYATNLHAGNAAGLSYYSAHTARLALGSAPELPVPPFLVGPGTAAGLVERVRRSLAELPDSADLVTPRPQHPWGFVAQTEPGQLDLEGIRAACREFDAASDQLADSHPLHRMVSLVRTPDELATLASIATAPRAQLWVLDDVRNPFWLPAAKNAQQRTVDFARARHAGLDAAYPAILDLPLEELQRQAQAAAASGFFGRKKRLRAVLEQLRPGLRTDTDIVLKELPDLLGQLVQGQQAAARLAAEVNRIPGVLLSRHWNPLTEQAVEELDGQLSWLQWASSWVAPDTAGPAGRALRDFLSVEGELAPDEAAALTRLVAAGEQLVRVAASSTEQTELWSGEGGLLRAWRSSATGRDLADPQLLGLRRWLSFVSALQPLDEAGLTLARVSLLDGSVPAGEAAQAFDRGVATASLTERAAATGLDGFDPAVHDRTIGRFASSARAVRAQLASGLPHDLVERRSFDSAGVSGRIGALRRELSKQRRGLSVRGLVSQYGDLITAVTPCVLVSPDSLSRFFSAQDGLFDVVVFDEASQIRVADAVGAMGRAHSVVVVGDSKQMPPTSFGETALDSGELTGQDDPEVLDVLTAVEDEESILSECVQARVPRRWLSWHYRSQDESLIAFSNALYYEDRLSSFPSPHLSQVGPGPDGVGVSLVRVDGTFVRTRGPLHRTNSAEADRIVSEVRLRFDASPEAIPSIGIVTFNVQQRALIEGLLRDCDDERVVQALESPDEGLFVKNLENVQGDERDVIFFSTAFSVDRFGRLPLNFGPLNREGGERRLNVAVTRARRQVLVFSSFDPEQLRVEETSSRGIKDLRVYLDLAASGPQVLTSLVTRPRRPVVLDRHREQVAEALRARGFTVATNVGLSDFRIDLTVALPEDPERPRLAVLLDGPGWASRGTVGDRDGLPHEVLSELMRWPAVERVWLPAWLRDPDAVLRRLMEAAQPADPEPTGVGPIAVVGTLDGQLSESQEPEGVVFEPSSPELSAASVAGGWPTLPATPASTDSDSPSADPQDGWFQPWVPQPRGARRVLDALPQPVALDQVRAVILEVATAEGPVHEERLARLVARGFDLSRLVEHRTRAILRAVPQELWDLSGEPFVWPPDLDQTSWSGFRRQRTTGERALEHISLREIGNAMESLVRAAAGMSVADLCHEANGAFGGTRLTPSVRARLESALTTALAHGRLVQNADLVSPGSEPPR